MEAVCTFETVLPSYQTASYHTPEDLYRKLSPSVDTIEQSIYTPLCGRNSEFYNVSRGDTQTEVLVTRTPQRDKSIPVQFMFRFDPIQSSNPHAVQRGSKSLRSDNFTYLCSQSALT
jgi:hypothetical protein